MLSKNLPFSEKLWKLLLRVLLDNIAGLQAIVKGDFKMMAAVWSAHYHFIKWSIKKKNRNSLPKKKMKELTGVYYSSVAWRYFIGKRKTFSEIVGFKK